MIKNKLTILLGILLVLASVNAQEIPENSYISSSDVQSQFSDPSIKLSFHSWGEGRETVLNLDDYFIGERTSDNRYLFITPPEIEIKIDQETSRATLKARGKWLGTKDVVFTRSSLYTLERTRDELSGYKTELVKKRIPPKIKNQFEEYRDKPYFDFIESVLDELEKKKSTETLEVRAIFEQNQLSINVGDDIDLSVGVETEVNGVKTKRPKLEVNVRPSQRQLVEEEELGEGLPIVVLFPLILMGGTLLVVGIIYLRRNKTSLRKVIPKIRITKPEIIRKDVKELREISKKLRLVGSQLSTTPIDQSNEKAFALVKDFFNTITHSNYEFTYSEVTKEILEEELSQTTENYLIKFSKEIEDFRYSNKGVTIPGLSQVIQKVDKGINLSVHDFTKLQTSEELELGRKRPVRHLYLKLKDYLSGAAPTRVSSGHSVKHFFLNLVGLDKKHTKKTIKKKEVKVKRKTHFSIKQFLRKNLGLFKTDKEVRRIIILKKQAAHRRKLEKRKAIIQYFKDNFGLFKTHEDKERDKREKLRIKLKKERIIEELKEKKRKAQLAKRAAFKKFFRDYFGLFKTHEDKERDKREKLRIKLKKERLVEELKEKKRKAKLAKRAAFKKFFRDYFGLFKTRESIEREIRTRLLEKRRKKIARKKAILKFFHDNFGIFKTEGEIRGERQRKQQLILQKQELERKIELEKIRAKEAKKAAVRRFFHDHFGMYKTQEEKEEIIRVRFELKRKKAAAKRAAIRAFFHDTLGIKTLKEKEEERVRKGQLKIKVLKEKRRLRTEKAKAVRKFFHDNFGMYKSDAEKEQIQILKLREKRRKSIARRREVIKYFHDNLGLFKSKAEVRREKELKERHERKIRIEKEKTKIARKASLRRILHKTLGLYKTPEDKREIAVKKRLEKEKKDRKEERDLNKKLKLKAARKIAFRKFLHDNLGFYKTKAEIHRIKLKEKEIKVKKARKKELDLKLAAERKIKLRKFLHDYLGFHKTSIEKQKDKEEDKIRKLKLRKFLHDHLGFYKTPLEKREDKKQARIKKLELKNKLIESSNLFREFFHRKLSPSDEIHVLIRLEENAMKAGNIRKAKKLQKKINRLYHKVKLEAPTPKHKSLKEKIKLAKANLFSKEQEQVPFMLKLKTLFTKKAEPSRADEVLYLVEKAEKALDKNRKAEAQEIYQRVAYVYKKLDRDSKAQVQNKVLNLRDEVTTIVLRRALKNAHDALTMGEIRTAKGIFKKIKHNFYYLPTKHKESLIEEKASLAEKLDKTKKKFTIKLPKIPFPSFNIITLINLEKEKIKEKLSQFKIERKPKAPPIYKESFKEFALAKKPKFISIITDTIPKKQLERNVNRKIKEIMHHLSSTHKHIEKKDHHKAKEKYTQALELFKDHAHELPEEFHNTFYKKFKPIKEKILHLGLGNLLSEVQSSVKRGEHKAAMQIQNKIHNIHLHLSKSSALPFTPPQSKITEINKLIRETRRELIHKKHKKARENYSKIIHIYEKLDDIEKREVYNKMLKIYREL